MSEQALQRQGEHAVHAAVDETVRRARLQVQEMRERPVRSFVDVPTAGFRHFSDHRQQLHIRRHAQTRPLVRVRLSVLELQALGQVIDRTTAVVVLHQDGAGERRQAVHQGGGRDRPGEMRNEPDVMSLA